MLQSKLFPHTFSREDPKDEQALSAKLLLRAGYIEKLGAGIYTMLPLGLKVLNRVANIIREEMNAVDAQELFMPALHPKEAWEKTGRWDTAKEVMYQFKDNHGHAWGLGFTHEEIITAIAAHHVTSYRDLPLYLYQIQTKFRNEPRATSGLLRGREFMMKDLYSFHSTEQDRAAYYDRVAQAYRTIFTRCGLNALYTEASGGLFSARSHEFQVLADVGEDMVHYCPQGDYAYNKEIYTADMKCPTHPQETFKEGRCIEVGNIFPLGIRFSESLGACITMEDGTRRPVVMGSYGIGLGRTMATAVEVSHDEKGIIWPASLAPYDIHIIPLASKDAPETKTVFARAHALYSEFIKRGADVLLDDREGVSAGIKFAESDLLGIPLRFVVSAKTLAQESVEVKKRNEKEAQLMKIVSVAQLGIYLDSNGT